mmetsp:Transcript_16525/g.47943  ORF Transcript_16525/g.47943 Transcript_16525/m.47943 type:complete len:588 (-) Transcript_16525:18-1781(-)
MRYYETGSWGVSFIFSLRGSVFPKAFAWALPGSILTIVVHFALRADPVIWTSIEQAIVEDFETSQLWVGYNFLLAFLLTFRSGKAYARWWEGGTLLQQARGEWLNAYSSLLAFCTTETTRHHEAIAFQQILASLMSMLFAAALNSVSSEEMDLEIVQLVEVNESSEEFLKGSADKCEVIVHWIQRLIVANMQSGVIPIPPPVISRVFQELSRGMVNVNNVRKISDFFFPFPYAQLAGCMLLLNMVVTPLLTGILVVKWYSAAFLAFLTIFAFCSLNYIAIEIECPFGLDENDLPMTGFQIVFNRSLVMLLERQAQTIPADQNAITIEVFEAEASGDTAKAIAFRRMRSIMGATAGTKERGEVFNDAMGAMLSASSSATEDGSDGRFRKTPAPCYSSGEGGETPTHSPIRTSVNGRDGMGEHHERTHHQESNSPTARAAAWLRRAGGGSKESSGHRRGGIGRFMRADPHRMKTRVSFQDEVMAQQRRGSGCSDNGSAEHKSSEIDGTEDIGSTNVFRSSGRSDDDVPSLTLPSFSSSRLEREAARTDAGRPPRGPTSRPACGQPLQPVHEPASEIDSGGDDELNRSSA